MEIEITKMKTELTDTVSYKLVTENEPIIMNDLLNRDIKMVFTGKTQCQCCRKFVKKLFAQGFCYDCFLNAPQAAPCIINPQLCEAHLGKGRNPEWENTHHNQPHYVYLAVASDVKVGVTRCTQIPTRWIDQGASYAIKVAQTPYRQLAGEIEVALKSRFTDKTSWQAMLKNQIAEVDIIEEKWLLEELLPNDLSDYLTDDDEITEINYPVIEYPQKIVSLGFDKTTEIKGKLLGIKGQYLIFDHNRVLNIRKHEGYHVAFEF